MTFSDVVKEILSAHSNPMTPQEIRDQVKKGHPEFCGTPSALRNVEKGHYKDTDHALLARIYGLVRKSNAFKCDNNTKPMKVSLANPERPRATVTQPSRSVSVRASVRSRAIVYSGKIDDILADADKYHNAYYQAEIFGGPSLYFHKRALETRHSPTSRAHLEYVYATLASWGMHRMGAGGSKMKSFEVFCRSVQDLSDKVTQAQAFDFRNMTVANWDVLKEIFLGLDVMASETTIVGNSKVMHHMLPNIVPPIDREYTLQFLFGTKTIRNGKQREWELMKEIISRFFIPVASDTLFRSKADRWITRSTDFPWDTSILKLVDNLVIGAMKQPTPPMPTLVLENHNQEGPHDVEGQEDNTMGFTTYMNTANPHVTIHRDGCNQIRKHGGETPVRQRKLSQP